MTTYNLSFQRRAPVTLRVQTTGVAVGVVAALGCHLQAAAQFQSEDFNAFLAQAISDAASRTDSEARRGAVRDMLRFGKYKPTGRGKPASEYLLAAAIEGRFPRINNLVDVLNLVSLQTLLPISLLDLDRAETDLFTLRRGRVGEKYVFNAGGQEIALDDLLLIARGEQDEACANAVKDSMATKLNDTSRNVLAVIYAPETLAADAKRAAQMLAEGLKSWGNADEVLVV